MNRYSVQCFRLDFFLLDNFVVQAAEALGAIGLLSTISILRRSLDSDPAEEVRETCKLALRRIEFQNSAGEGSETSSEVESLFGTVDPALPMSQSSSVEQLRYCIMK